MKISTSTKWDRTRWVLEGNISGYLEVIRPVFLGEPGLEKTIRLSMYEDYLNITITFDSMANWFDIDWIANEYNKTQNI